MIQAALHKHGLPASGPGSELTRVSHPPYDFATKPFVCTSCGRILSAEDD